MSAGFTKGPWYPTEDDGDWYIGASVQAVPTIVADIEPGPSAAANARLIAASPDLFEALKYARNLIGADEIIDAALTKASGGNDAR